jgi:hypothetical protein
VQNLAKAERLTRGHAFTRLVLYPPPCMPAILFVIAKEFILLLPSVLVVGCIDQVGNTVPSTQTVAAPLRIPRAKVRLSRLDEPPFYHYAGGNFNRLLNVMQFAKRNYEV